MTSPSFAIEPINLSSSDNVLDLTHATDVYSNRGEDFQVYTAADIDGIIRRIEVRSSSIDHRGDWAVFALANTSDIQLERLIVVPHYRLVGSNFFWPDLGSKRIISVTPSEGFSLDRLPSPDSDIFRITINPGAIVTFVMELTVPNLLQIYLWEPNFYKDTVNSFTLYHGIVLGISGLLAIFLTVIFMVNGSSMLIASAALSWIVFGYICIDFGFISKFMDISPGDLPIWRACAEVSLSSSLIVFLFMYIDLNSWPINLRYMRFGFIIWLVMLFFISFYNPSIASGIARLSFCGIFLLFYLGNNIYGRVITLIPTCLFILIWSIGAWMAITSRLDNDIIQPALSGGLVVIVLLIGLMMTQHVMSGSILAQGSSSDMVSQSLSVLDPRDFLWSWDAILDRVTTTPDISAIFGFSPGSMQGSIHNWLTYVYPDDQDGFRAIFDSFLSCKRGKLKHEFRIRANDRLLRWIVIKVLPVLNANGEILRCVGVASDITEEKNSIERLLCDSFKDNLTGLPNRQSFIDRLTTILSLSLYDDNLCPNIIVIDIDKYQHIINTFGIAIGDNIIVALTRRIRMLLQPQDTLARLSVNRFGIILTSEKNVKKISEFTSTINKSIEAPIHLFNRELIINASIGLTIYKDPQLTATEMLKGAEIAMSRAKLAGGNRIEIFRSSFGLIDKNKSQIKEALCHAIDNSSLCIAYQPIIRLADSKIIGFEAITILNQSNFRNISYSELVSIAEESDMINQLNLSILESISIDVINWRDNMRVIPFFISINISSEYLLNSELCADIQAFISKTICSPNILRLEFSESILMNNPEKIMLLFGRLQKIGVGLTINNFGTKLPLLSYLNQIPFDFLKINGSIVTGSTEKRISILRSIISIARKLGVNIIAKDFCNEIDKRELSKIGCNYAQNYNYGSPMSSNAVLKLFKEINNR
ncbi:EAL domain-containing protein [Candidatus Liberibacter americanus]|uniref:Sensory box/GGDEF family protein n=1 Tax=Candidatus Liberibacter americanus str. Sao Paulo TaxID=1261131 RepID=U6B342_9HYPH|nr:sensory box/GGDEF family protein [Candidatus Liberibacter americanus str. Sao Paulo]